MTAHSKTSRGSGQRGAALVEFVLVLPLFVLVLFGLISFGMTLALKQGVTNASADAARSVIGTPTSTVDAGKTKAETTVASRLSWLGANASFIVTDVKWYDPVTSSCVAVPLGSAPPSPATICVKVTYPYGAHKLVPIPAFGVDELSSEARVQVSS